MSPVATPGPSRTALFRVRLGLVLAALLLHGPLARADAAPLTACADPPAWTLTATAASGSARPSKSTFSFDLLEAALARLGRSVRYLPMPWARCLQQVEAGEIDFALGAYYSDERARRFAFSVPYSKATPQVFYWRSRPVRVEAMADLHRYHGCGLRAGSYGHYGLQPGELDLGVNSYDKLITKLREGRCDFFVEELEVIAGYKRIGTDYLADPDLAHGPVPGVVAPAAHLVSALHGRGATLMPQLDQALQELIRSGQAAQFWRLHAGDIPYQAP